MKRFFVIFMAAMLMFSLAACGGKGSTGGSGAGSDSEVPGTGNDSEVPGTDRPDNNPGESAVKSPMELLNAVWDSYGEDDKFPAAGGDMSEENSTMDAPGKFGVGDAAAMDATLGFPAAYAGKIDDAASLVHMMNANTFTCGAFHVKAADDTEAVSAAIKDNIMQRQWMCGFPDKLVIVKADGCIVSIFGENELVDTFKTKLTEVCASAEIFCDEPVA